MKLAKYGLTKNKKTFRYVKSRKKQSGICATEGCNNKISKIHHKYCKECHIKKYRY